MIAINIDGVIADSLSVLEEEIEIRSGKTIARTTPREFKIAINVSDTDIMKYFDSAIINYSHFIPVYDKKRTTQALKLLQNSQGTIQFLTARSNNPSVIDATNDWIKSNFPDIDFTVHFVGYNGNKYEWLKDNNFDSIVEDRLKTVNNMKTMTPYLVNRLWNIGRPSLNHVVRVNDLFDAVTHYLTGDHNESRNC